MISIQQHMQQLEFQAPCQRLVLHFRSLGSDSMAQSDLQKSAHSEYKDNNINYGNINDNNILFQNT